MNIRKGIKADIPQTFNLIKELAIYEKALHEITNTIEQMYIDGFGEHPIFGFYVAEEENKVVGIALYYYRYSTWKGKRIYLEDIIVTEAFRGKGLGSQLFEAILIEGKIQQCTGLMLQVLDWNEPSIEFYKKYNIRFDPEWLNGHIDY
jgi:GNAT superfamily N-acetyltransferase